MQFCCNLACPLCRLIAYIIILTILAVTILNSMILFQYESSWCLILWYQPFHRNLMSGYSTKVGSSIKKLVFGETMNPFTDCVLYYGDHHKIIQTKNVMFNVRNFLQQAASGHLLMQLTHWTCDRGTQCLAFVLWVQVAKWCSIS